MNPIDLDGDSNGKREFFDVDLEEGVNEITYSPKSFLSDTLDPRDISPYNLKSQWTRVKGRAGRCNGLCEGDPREEDYSAAINFFQPKTSLKFSYGVHGKNFGDGSPTNGRLFSVALGDTIVSEGLEPPELTPIEDEATIEVDCPIAFEIEATGACLNDVFGWKKLIAAE